MILISQNVTLAYLHSFVYLFITSFTQPTIARTHISDYMRYQQRGGEEEKKPVWIYDPRRHYMDKKVKLRRDSSTWVAHLAAGKVR